VCTRQQQNLPPQPPPFYTTLAFVGMLAAAVAIAAPDAAGLRDWTSLFLSTSLALLGYPWQRPRR
jgi:hypothetical protein